MPLLLPPIADRGEEVRERHGLEQALLRECVTQAREALVEDEVDWELVAEVAAEDGVAEMLVLRQVVAPLLAIACRPQVLVVLVKDLDQPLHQHKEAALRARGYRADPPGPGLQNDALLQVVGCGMWQKKLEMGPLSTMCFSKG